MMFKSSVLILIILFFIPHSFIVIFCIMKKSIGHNTYEVFMYFR